MAEQSNSSMILSTPNKGNTQNYIIKINKAENLYIVVKRQMLILINLEREYLE